MQNISAINKIFDIFLNKFDSNIKIGNIQLTEKDIKSERNLIRALQKAMKKSDSGTYDISNNHGLFARFDIDNKRLIKIHKRSKNTGAIMPCWNHLKE